MKTIRSTIIDRVLAALKTISSVNDDNVMIARDTEITDFPALTLSDQGDTAIETDAMSVRRRINLTIDGEVQGDGGEDTTANYQSLKGDVAAALTLDIQWGGLAELSELGDSEVFVTPDGSIRQATFTLGYNIQYTHRPGAPDRQ